MTPVATNVLICSAGQRVSLVRAFQRELTALQPGGKVYTIDMNPGLSSACNVSDGYTQVPRVTDPSYIPQLLDLCRAKAITLVVPTIDTELRVLAQHKQEFADQGISVIVSSIDFVDQCRDKRKTGGFFAAHDIEVPAPVDRHQPTFPLFIKPYDGSLSVDTYVIRSAGELTAYHLQNEKFLFMEYMDPRDYDEFTVDLYLGRDNRLKCIVPRKRLLVRAGEVNKALACKNAIVPFLKQRLGHIPGAVGCLTLQLFLHRTNGRIVGIEINPRFGGGFPLTYRAGANYPRWLIQEYALGATLEYFDDWEDRLLMLRYDDEVLVHGYSA